MKTPHILLIIASSSITILLIIFLIAPIIKNHYQQENLASELSVMLKDYPGRNFPIPYFKSVLKPGISISEVHKIVRNYEIAYRCGNSTEIYYYYSSDDYKALRVKILYDERKRFLKLITEDNNSPSFHLDFCSPGIFEE